MSDSAAAVVRAKIIDEWRWTATELARLGTVFVRPSDVLSFIRVGERTSDAVIAIDIGPVALSVPERASSSKRLYVYVTGFFQFSRQTWEDGEMLETTHVSAEAAYFRAHQEGLVLVHGAHYDHAPSHLGHPVFHLQLRGSLVEYGSFVQAQFGLNGEIRDGISETLRNVRSASAQVDVFSLLLQVGADQLLDKNSGREQRRAFNKLRDRAVLCGSLCRDGEVAGVQAIPSSCPTVAFRCYRARHWYPSTTDAVPKH